MVIFIVGINKVIDLSFLEVEKYFSFGLEWIMYFVVVFLFWFYVCNVMFWG